MNRKIRTVVSVALVSSLVAGGAWAQRRGGGRTTAPPAEQVRVITIPCVEACHMMERLRVWMFTPPPGATAFGMSTLPEGRRVWALLPGCHQPNPDDPRDPCPVGHVSMEVVTGTGTVMSTEPQNVTSNPDSRRVQSFFVPNTVEAVRIKVHRRDGAVRYEAAVDAPALHNLPQPEGSGSGNGFQFTLTAYPSN